MDTIKIYLESIFQGLPRTEEILRLKSELLNNMEEKYHELKKDGKTENEAIGIVISEFGNIDELLNEMGIKISTNEDTLPTMSLEEVQQYMTLKVKTSNLIGIGVTLILLGVSLLIFLSQLVETQSTFKLIPREAQQVMPVIFLLLLIVPAVGMFIYSGTKLEKYKYIDEGQFQLSSTTKAILNKEFGSFSTKNTIGIITGVCLCILSPIAIFIGSMFGKTASTYGVSILLIIIAIAVFIFVHFGNISGGYKKLLKIDEYSQARKKEDKVIGAVAALVWPLATCIFLFSGFVYNLWHICWIIFPITGILFGAFCAFYNAINTK